MAIDGHTIPKSCLIVAGIRNAGRGIGMAKLKQEDLPLGTASDNIVFIRKPNRHVVIALNHMNKRREALLAKRAELNREIEELDAAILALG